MGAKGKSKTGGRKKATPNKRSRKAIEILAGKKFCPLEKMIGIYETAMEVFENQYIDGTVFDALKCFISFPPSQYPPKSYLVHPRALCQWTFAWGGHIGRALLIGCRLFLGI